MQSNAEHLEVSTIINVNLQKILPVGYSQRREAFVILILEHIEHDGQPCSEYSTCGWDGHDCKVEEDGAQIYNQRLSIDKKKLCQVCRDHTFRPIGTEDFSYFVVLCSNKAGKIEDIQSRR